MEKKSSRRTGRSATGDRFRCILSVIGRSVCASGMVLWLDDPDEAKCCSATEGGCEFSRSAPTRHPEPEFPESDFPASPAPSASRQSRTRASWSTFVSVDHRRMFVRVLVYALLASTAIAFLIPARYKSTARLMPPDNQSNSSNLGAMVAAATSTLNDDGLQGLASDFLGLKSTSEIFVGILGSNTVQDDLIHRFDLQKAYWDRHIEDARADLAAHTDISIDRKSQIIEITVTDRNRERATVMCQAYVDELNRLVAQLSTSAARRERIFLEGRLQEVNRDLEAAEKEFSQFASKNTTIDVKGTGQGYGRCGGHPARAAYRCRIRARGP